MCLALDRLELQKEQDRRLSVAVTESLVVRGDRRIEGGVRLQRARGTFIFCFLWRMGPSLPCERENRR